MGIFDKLLFWKRKDEFDFDDLANKQMPGGEMPHPSEFAEQTQNPFEEKPVFPDNSPFDKHEEDPFGTKSSFSPTGMAQPQKPSYPGAQQSAPQQAYGGPNRDLELINSKLDTLKAMLTTIEQRMTDIERTTGADKPKKQERLW